MKTFFTILFISIFIYCPLLTFAQCDCVDEKVTTTSINSSEGFESYSANQPIPLSGNWSLYPAGPGYNPIAATVVSSPVNCGSRSLRFQYSGQPVDMNYIIDEKRTSFKMYIPSNKSGKVAYLLGDGETTHFSIAFNQNGSGSVSTGGSFTYPQGTWFRVSLIKVGNAFQLFINYDNVATIGSISVAAFANFYSNESNDLFYIDKLCNYYYNGIQVLCTQEFNPQCLNLSNEPAGNNSCQARIPGYINLEFAGCSGGGFSPCDNAMSITCGETINGSTIGENFKFYRPDYSSCLANDNSNDYQAPDKVYTFTHDGNGDVSIHLWSQTPNVDLDVFLLDECGTAWSGNPEIVITNVPPNTTNPNIHCIGRGISYIDPSGYDTDFIYAKDLPAGTYYIVVDGQHWQAGNFPNDVGNFELSLHCNGLSCANGTIIKCGDKLINQSNVTGDNNVSIYCSPSPNTGGNPSYTLPPGTGCTGKERVYKFTPDIDGPVELSVTKIDVNEDFEVFVFTSCDPTICLASGTNDFGQSELVTFNGEKGREYVIVVDGYHGTSGSYDIEIKCTRKKLCDVCMQCFKHRPRMNTTQTFEFFSGWCDGDLMQKSQVFTNVWSVENTNVTYLDNTNNASTNPIIVFPGTGKYRVCQKIYSGSTLLYECCQWVDLKPCNSEPKAFFTTSYDANDGTYTINAAGSQNADNMEWQFSESGVSYINGNSTSSVSKISIPTGKCINVCIYVYNGCGMSTYCVKLCRNNSGCAGPLPPTLFASLPQPVIEGRKITFTAPQITNASYTYDLGDESILVSSRSLSYTYPKDGNYTVCLRVVVGCYTYCYCWCVRPRLCPILFEPPVGMIKYQFTGSSSDPKYTLTTQNFTVAPTEDWLIDGNTMINSKGKTSLQISLPIDKDYTICIPYLKSNGCLAYKCIILKGGNPFNCNIISWKYLPNQGYQFQLPSEYSEIEWTVDETSQSLGSASISAILPPPANCVYRNISVRYFDGTRYIICCLRIYVCDPFNCRSNIKYYNENGQAKFELTESGANNTTWFFDDASSTSLGSANAILLPYPTNCQARTISVRYRDANGNWRICCLVIYWCNPTKCESSIIFTPNGNNTILSTQNSFQEIEWYVDNVYLGQGNNFIATIPSNGQNIYVKYRDPATGCVYVCCKKLTPPANILIIDIGDNFCGPKGSEILVPVTVKNYKKVASIQFDIASSNVTVADIIGVQDFHPNSGIVATDFTILNDQSLRFFTSSFTEINLNDDAVLFNLKVRINGNLNTSASLHIQGTIKAYDINVTEIPVATFDGSACSGSNKLTISGTLKNRNGKPIVNGNSRPEISIKYNNTISAISAELNGDYLASNLNANQTYELAPLFDENLLKGIDVADLLILRKHMQGVTLFNAPLTHYAADMNDDKLIDVADLLILRKIMQGITTTLPNERKAWKFVPNSFTFPSTINPLSAGVPSSIIYNPLISSQTIQNYTGVKRGDLNHSAIPLASPVVVKRSNTDVELVVGDATDISGSTISIGIKANKFVRGGAMQFSLTWPTDKLQLVEVPKGQDILIPGVTIFDQTQLASGHLGFIWETDDFTSGTTLSDGTIIYNFKFKLIGANNSSATIESSIEPKISKLVDIDGAELNMRINSGTVTIMLPSATIDDSLDKFIKVYPNPTTGIITLESAYIDDIKNLEISSMDGRFIQNINEFRTKSIDLSHLNPGSYIIKGLWNDHAFARKVIIIK